MGSVARLRNGGVMQDLPKKRAIASDACYAAWGSSADLSRHTGLKPWHNPCKVRAP
jgi:hypothetical protein